ncbi:SMI1/KNR4 family protein [Amycolatopsis roodepoortensis]|uniref:SMI1/KNR4 family protein n=1 Tax=Amycolatopsis roodepoortensis TaxID=700274 RepID=UPI00214AD671|nr:SMI1/KNR4 family protein [Amycolatopsis roodepoortensis]UUV31988.1 SMI1/KNR4 family protein [Amycolatopsis roodepoortensis]
MEATWRRIMALLSEHAPAIAREIRPPAPAAHVARLRDRVGLELPPELLTWWALMDGVDDERVRGAEDLIPKGYLPLSVARAEEEYARQSRYPDPGCCNPAGTHHKQAGQDGFPYCTANLPIGRAIDGGLLCVDLRAGEHHGCVMEWYASEGIYRSDWASVAEILDEMDERLSRP